MKIIFNQVTENAIAFPTSISPPIFVVDSVCIRSPNKKEPSSFSSFKSSTATEKQAKDKVILGLRDHEKVEGTHNTTLSLVTTATIENHIVSRILIGDGSSCDMMYIRIFMKLGLHKQYLKLCEGKNLIAFYRFSLGGGKENRTISVQFLVVLLKMSTTTILKDHSWHS